MHATVRLTVLACLLLGVFGCDQQSDSASYEEGQLYTYQVRGRVESVQGSTAQITHEAIPTFVHHTGKADGMDAMMMPFTLGGDVEPGSLKPGDLISFTLHMRWEPSADSWIDNITTLPADTQLELPEMGGDDHAGHDHDHADHDH